MWDEGATEAVGEEGLVTIVIPSVATDRDPELVGTFGLCILGPLLLRKASTELML